MWAPMGPMPGLSLPYLLLPDHAMAALGWVVQMVVAQGWVVHATAALGWVVQAGSSPYRTRIQT